MEAALVCKPFGGEDLKGRAGWQRWPLTSYRQLAPEWRSVLLLPPPLGSRQLAHQASRKGLAVGAAVEMERNARSSPALHLASSLWGDGMIIGCHA